MNRSASNAVSICRVPSRRQCASWCSSISAGICVFDRPWYDLRWWPGLLDERLVSMDRILTYGLLAVSIIAPAGQQPPFRGTTDAVHVFVTVTDRDGRLVTTRSRNDFDVRDDGKPQ